jgi:DNA repair protein RecO (recombination protein O)
MFVTTKGIVLHKTKYSDSSIIVKIFTEHFGTQSFIIKNAFSKKSKINYTFFTSLSLLEITFDDVIIHKLGFLKDVNYIKHYSKIPFEPSRNAILFFYNELLYKLLNNSLEDPKLFYMLEKALIELDTVETLVPDIHLHFLADLIQTLGIFPENDYSDRRPFFSLQDNRFSDIFVDNNYYLSEQASTYFSGILNQNKGDLAAKSVRNEVLTGMVQYLILHNDHIYSLDSLEVLFELMK